MDKKQSKYSKYRSGKIDFKAEKAFLALIDNSCEKTIWMPKSVVDSETKLIKQWFVDNKNQELKDFKRTKK